MDQNRILDLHFFESDPPIGIELYMEPETTVASLLFVEQDTTKPQSKNPADLFPKRQQLCRCQIFWNVCRKFQWNSLTASLDDLIKFMSPHDNKEKNWLKRKTQWIILQSKLECKYLDPEYIPIDLKKHFLKKYSNRYQIVSRMTLLTCCFICK